MTIPITQEQRAEIQLWLNANEFIDYKNGYYSRSYGLGHSHVEMCVGLHDGCTFATVALKDSGEDARRVVYVGEVWHAASLDKLWSALNSMSYDARPPQP